MWPWHNHGLSSLPALCARLCTGSVIALAGCAAIRAGPPRNDRRPRKPNRARSQDDRQIVRPSAARSLRRYAVPPRLSSTSPLHEFLLTPMRSEEHTSELQSRSDLVCRLLLEKKNNRIPFGKTKPPRRPAAHNTVEPSLTMEPVRQISHPN